LPLGQRILAAVFQAASSRHTGTSTFNLSHSTLYADIRRLIVRFLGSQTTRESAMAWLYDDEIDRGGLHRCLWCQAANGLDQ
jgi:hypothetical protein